MVAGFDESSIEIVHFSKGKVLFKQGSVSDAVYIVNSGIIGLYRESHKRKVLLATARRGELFGEMAAIDKSPRLATALTLEDSTLMAISIDVIMGRMREADPVIKALIHVLMNNLRGLHESHMPKPQSFVDTVNEVQRQYSTVTRCLPKSIRAELDANLKILDAAIKDLHLIAMEHPGQDRHDEAILNEADLPHQD